MVKSTETVTVGALREKTAQEIKEENATAGVESNYDRDPKEAHKQAAELSVETQEAPEFRTDDIATPKLGAMVEEVETKTTTTTSPKATIKGEPEQLIAIKLLLDWRDGQGILHEHGKTLNLPSNEAIRLVQERRAERADPPADSK